MLQAWRVPRPWLGACGAPARGAPVGALTLTALAEGIRAAGAAHGTPAPGLSPSLNLNLPWREPGRATTIPTAGGELLSRPFPQEPAPEGPQLVSRRAAWGKGR